jgi:hypothetical protein
MVERFADPDQAPPWWLLLVAVGSLVSGTLLLEGGARTEFDAGVEAVDEAKTSQ